MRDITIGQFYNVDSPVHRLDPRVKIIFAMIFVVSLFLGKNPFLFLIAFAVLAVYIKISNVPLKFIFRGMKTLSLIILLSGLLNLFTVKGVNVVFEWGMIRITENGIHATIYTTLRLGFMIVGSSMMTYTTTPNSLTDGLEKMLGWMKKLGVPVHEFAMIMSIALRFVPVLVEELDKIMKAQMARGIDFNEGNLFVRLRKLIPILVPLIVSAMKRSEELAMAMDARCYHGGEGRTKMKPLVYQRRDYIAYALIFVYLIGMVMLAVVF